MVLFRIIPHPTPQSPLAWPLPGEKRGDAARALLLQFRSTEQLPLAAEADDELRGQRAEAAAAPPPAAEDAGRGCAVPPPPPGWVSSSSSLPAKKKKNPSRREATAGALPARARPAAAGADYVPLPPLLMMRGAAAAGGTVPLALPWEAAVAAAAAAIDGTDGSEAMDVGPDEALLLLNFSLSGEEDLCQQQAL